MNTAKSFAAGTHHYERGFELGVQKKIICCREEKRRIALTASRYVKDGDCTCTSLEAAAIKKHAMANSRHAYVVADSGKCQESGIVCFAAFDEFDAIITNPMAQSVPKLIVFCD